MGSTYTSGYPHRLDPIVIVGTEETANDSFRRQLRDYRRLENQIRAIQTTLGLGSPDKSVLELADTAAALADQVLALKPRTLSIQTGSASTTGTSETDLLSYTLPDSLLAKHGDRVVIEAYFDCLGLIGSATRTLKLYFGADSFTVFTVTGSSNYTAHLYAIISRTGAADQFVFSQFLGDLVTSNGLLGDVLSSSTAFTRTLADSNIIKVTGETDDAAGPITQNYMSINLVPS